MRYLTPVNRPGRPDFHRAGCQRVARWEAGAPERLPRIRIYGLRHTATSLMIDAGTDLNDASEALSHSDPRITMAGYRHVRGDQRAASPIPSR